MREIKGTDILLTRRQCHLTGGDFIYLDDLYSPIVGTLPIALYRSLFGLKEKEITHETFLRKIKMTSGEFLSSLYPLEALGLVRTFLKEEDEKRRFTYCLFAPLIPTKFLSSPLYKALLQRAVSKEEFQALVDKYSLGSLPKEKEVSTNFREYFAEEIRELSYDPSGTPSSRHTRAKIAFEYDENVFLDELKKCDDRFSRRAFSNKEWARIGQSIMIYDYTEESMASIVATSFDFSAPLGKRLNNDKFDEECMRSSRLSYMKKELPTSEEEPLIKGSDGVAKTLRKMETMTPGGFLTFLQHGHKPAMSDLEILKHLSKETGMTSPAINALVFHILVIKGENLNFKYCEKVGATIVRKNLTNAIDVSNYLQNSSRRKKKSDSASYFAEEKETPAPKVAEMPKAVEPPEEDEDIDDLFAAYKERLG